MSTIVERPGTAGQASVEGRSWVDQALAWRPALTPDLVAMTAIFLVAFGLRFWNLGDRAIHHDESLHATYSWYLYMGKGYQHHPLMHGPFLFHAMALVYFLFGVTDSTARFVPAGFGAAMVLVPLLLRPWLGRIGVIAAAALLAVSPTMLYFSRFVGAGAQDIIVAVAMLLMVAGVWHYLKTGATKWIYLTAAALALGFTTKEVTYILAAILVLYLNGAAAASFAAQLARAGDASLTDDEAESVDAVDGATAPRGAADGDRRLSPAQERLWAAGLMTVAWALVLFWPWLKARRERWRLTEFPRAGGLMIVIGTLSAPMFSAASQIVLERLGVRMEARAPFGDWTNEQFWGALTIGGLIALGAYFGTGWKEKEWLIAAAIFWGISIPLFTTFFTNMDGVATGIWGSLDYWLQQQDVRRGTQPAWYYLVITPVYEHLIFGLALAGIVWTAIKTSLDTILAAVLAVAAVVVGVLVGDAAHVTLLFMVVALLATTYAVRGQSFRQFMTFWLGALLIGLSASGEKMPWLEVHLALPMALLAALSIDEAAAAVRGLALPAWVRPVAGLGALGVAGALLAVRADASPPAGPLAVVAFLAGCAAVVYLGVQRNPAAGLAGAALVVGMFGPLTVRAAGMAAYTHGDIPVEMLVYTQSSPELTHIRDEITQYSKDSGLGYDLPVIVDSTEAFTWPWAWYLRDYKHVSYPDLSAYRNNPQLQATLPRDGVVLAQMANADVGASLPDVYGPGQQYKHRWWFPEEAYRSFSTENFLDWVRKPAYWRKWGSFFMDRIPSSMAGSIDAVAYFPVSYTPAAVSNVQAQPAPEPVVGQDGRIIAGVPGRGNGQLQRPAGLATDAQGDVYVADSLNNRVQKLGPDGRLLATLTGTGANRFREPWGVAVDAQGNVYVADTWNHRIEKFDRDLNFVKAWGGPPAGGNAPPGLLELYGPRSIAVDAQGNLWVTDTGDSRLIKYSADGQPLGSVGQAGTGPGQFQEPVAVAISPNGDLVVTDAWNGRVQILSATGEYKAEFRVEGWAQDRGIDNKPYVAVARDGSIFAVVPITGQVLHLSATGQPLAPVASLADGAAVPPRPLGIALAPDGRLWVSDGAGGRVVGLPQ